MKLCRF